VTAEIPEAFVGVFAPPPVSGIGNAGGYKMQIQDRGGAGYDQLQNLAFAMMMKANATPACSAISPPSAQTCRRSGSKWTA
jgi:multidrug efflux pump subunit AcrB